MPQPATPLVRLVEPGERFRLPEIVCTTPPRINPDYPTIYERNAAWVRQFLPFADADTLARHLEARYPLWDSLVLPTGLAERVFCASCVTSLMFRVDDVAFLERALFAEVADGWVAGHSFGPAFAAAFGTLEARMPATVYPRFLAFWQEWFVRALEENRFRARGEVPDLDTYVAIRRVSIGLRPTIVCLEFVQDQDLTTLLRDDPDCVRMAEVAAEHEVLVNDVCSFRSEYFRGDYFNSIACLMHAHGRTLQGAVDSVCDRIRTLDDELTTLRDALRRRYAADPRAVQIHAYLDGICLICAGSLRWSLETARYHGHGYAFNGLRSGVVTLHANRTQVEAA